MVEEEECGSAGQGNINDKMMSKSISQKTKRKVPKQREKEGRERVGGTPRKLCVRDEQQSVRSGVILESWHRRADGIEGVRKRRGKGRVGSVERANGPIGRGQPSKGVQGR